MCLAAVPGHSAAPITDATLKPAQIALGESTELTISTLGTGMESIALPLVPGLEFRIIEQSRRMEFVHGASLATTTTVVRITPYLAGTFIIPGLAPKSQPLVLRVSPAGEAVNPKGSVLLGKGAAGAGGSANDIKMTEDGSAYLRLTLPKREVYVGESVPIAIELGARAGSVASLNGLPALTGSDFTLNNLPRQPDRTEKIIDGSPFVLLTWHTVLTAVKPGTFPLAVETPLTVKVSTRPKGEAQLEDQLGDPFLQRLFGATVRKDIKVASPTYDLTVQSLPVDGRPVNFGGAVGAFDIVSDLSPAASVAGDPLTLRMRVRGSGNFDRVDSTMLEHLDEWKTYPPKSSFAPSDALGYKGEKTFEQPIIASKAGPQTLPGLTFSYFDPATRRYETARSAPLEVMISPSPGEGAGMATGALASAGASPQSHLRVGLRPDHDVAGSGETSLVPLYFQAQFLALPAMLSLAFAGGWLVQRRGTSRPHHDDSVGARRMPKAAKRVLAQLKAAERSGNAGLFLNSARAALVQHRKDRELTAASEVSAEDIDAWYGSDAEDIRRLFALADEANYSDRQLAGVDFARWMRIVGRQLSRGPSR